MAAWFDMYCQMFRYGSCGSVPLADMPAVFGPMALGLGAVAIATYVMFTGPWESP